MPNGNVSGLVEVEPGILLEPYTGRDYLRWKAAARARGYNMAIARPAGGYRSIETQRDMHLRPWAYNLNPKSTATLAAPGYSRHGYGRAVDIVGAPETWVRTTMTAYGFHLWNGKDPNHYEHGNALAQAPAWSGGDIIPLPIPEDPEPTQEDTRMTTLYGVKIPATVPDADKAFLNTLLTSDALSIRSGIGIYALCGDSPGTYANVQLTQRDALGNAWAADHAGGLDKDRDGLDMPKGVRWLEWPHFIRTLSAYVTPLGGGSAPSNAATPAHVDAAADKVIAALPKGTTFPTKVTLEGSLS